MERALDHLREPKLLTRTDEFFMSSAVALAWLGAGRTRPNPLVGAVVVKDGLVVGEGFHPAYGLDHAETMALDAAGPAAEGATLYVTLEPCTHHGKTPPCSDRVLESRVRRVVVGTLDPDPRMNGRGIRILRDHGVDVEVGCAADRVLLLNLEYFKRALKMPAAVTLKMATTLDGRIASAPGRRDEITGLVSRTFAHRLRAVSGACLVGINTLLVDRPRLDCRLLDNVEPPVPVVVDSRLQMPAGYEGFGGRRCVVLTNGDVEADRLEREGCEVRGCRMLGGQVDLRAAIRELVATGIHSVLVEGGARVFANFLQSGCWDAMHVFVAPRIFGPDGVAMAGCAVAVDESEVVTAGATTFANDVVISYLNARTRRALLQWLLET